MPDKTPEKNSTPRKKIFFIIQNILLVLFVAFTFTILKTVLFPTCNTRTTLKQTKKKQNDVSIQLQFNNTSPEQTTPYTFEEKIGQDFDFKVRQADLALLQTIITWSKLGARLEHKNIATRYFYGRPFHFQTILVHLPVKHSTFFKKLQKNLKNFVTNTNSRLIINRHNNWSIVIDGQTTHLLIIESEPLANATNGANATRTIPKTAQKKGYLTIIIDDMGESLLFARNLAHLDFPVTFSVLPYSTRTRKICSLAKTSRIELMLQLNSHLIYGLYPEVLKAKDINHKRKILHELLNSYLLKDILAFERLKSSTLLTRLLKLLAYQIGSEVSLSELSRALGANKKASQKKRE
jgi:hypothetical protein